MSSNPIYRSYKYRFYPTESQVVLLDKTFGAVRFIWNHCTAAFNNYSVEGPTLARASVKNFRSNFEFLKEVPQNALEQKYNDFEETKKQFFNKNRKKSLGRMKFKKKGISRDSFRLSVNGFTIKDSVIKLAKLGQIDVVNHRPFNGIPKSITVSRNLCNQYFVSVLVQTEVELKQNTGKSIGIDLGLNHLCILSNGMKIDNPRFFRKSQTKLKLGQRHLSRKIKGSNRYNKQRLKVAKIHLKISNQRNHFLHCLSHRLVSNYDHIFMENLNVAGMKRSNLGKSISDAALSELTRQIEYKSNWYGKTFHQIDRWFPSSKTCSGCGYIFKGLERGTEEWTCPDCGSHHDRDINAAKNILIQGFKELYDLSHEEALDQSRKSAESVDYRHRENVRPTDATNCI